MEFGTDEYFYDKQTLFRSARRGEELLVRDGWCLWSRRRGAGGGGGPTIMVNVCGYLHKGACG